MCSHLGSPALSLLGLLLPLHGGHDLNLRGLPLLALHVFLPLVQNTVAKLNLMLLKKRTREREEEEGKKGQMPSQLRVDSVSFLDKANQRADADADVEIRCTRAQNVKRAANKKNTAVARTRLLTWCSIFACPRRKERRTGKGKNFQQPHTCDEIKRNIT